MLTELFMYCALVSMLLVVPASITFVIYLYDTLIADLQSKHSNVWEKTGKLMMWSNEFRMNYFPMVMKRNMPDRQKCRDLSIPFIRVIEMESLFLELLPPDTPVLKKIKLMKFVFYCGLIFGIGGVLSFFAFMFSTY